MKVLTFAGDNPQAALWFTMLYQSCATATPGPRPLKQLAIERDVLRKLESISGASAERTASGFQPRQLTEPCVVHVTDDELAVLTAYLASAGFQPYLSADVLELLASLASAPTVGA